MNFKGIKVRKQGKEERGNGVITLYSQKILKMNKKRKSQHRVSLSHYKESQIFKS